VFAGSYASADEDGIHVLKFDGDRGELRRIGGAGGIENPSFLAIDPARRRVYAVSERRTESAVAAFAFDPETGRLTELGRRPTHGGLACHLQVHPSGRWLLAVNYLHGSAVCVFPLDEEGAPGPAVCRVEHSGKGAREDRQERPHPHSVFRMPGRDDRYLVPDLGTDTVYAYLFDAKTGELRLIAENRLFAGGGPRHLACHRTLPIVYVFHEMGAAITVHELDAEIGSLRQLQRLSTLPAGRSPEEYPSGEIGAEILVSEAGDCVYASNRGHDSIAVFRVRPDGRLAPAGHVPSGGRKPRNFCLVEGGRWLLAANQDSGRIAVLAIGDGGLPVPTESYFAVPKPSFVKAVPARSFRA